MGKVGRETVAQLLPDLKKTHAIDFVVAQSENVSHGRSMLPRHMEELQSIGVDFFTGGNHTFKRAQLHEYLEDTTKPVIGPANAVSQPGQGWKIANTAAGEVLVVSLLGSVFPPDIEITNPLQSIDAILSQHQEHNFAAIVVNIHSDYSSEKVITGHYLDGRVSLVVGDHWHVPTADARILPNGTAHMSDVGMCGSLNSSLGIELSETIPRWRDGQKTKQLLAEAKPWQFNAALVDTQTPSIEHLQIIIDCH